MTIDLVPLSQFSARYSKGWRMVAGYPLQPGDYAVTMQSPGHKDPVKSNLAKASGIRNTLVARKRKQARLAALCESA